MTPEDRPADAASLAKVDHVVVLMLENRSFDHMLGYLSLTGRRPEIDGLRPGLANEYQERTYPVHHLAATALGMDPDHSSPPQAPDDEPEMFGRYGVRVPAIVVSPWVEPRTVSHTVFDHTSIIKTILLRSAHRRCLSSARPEEEAPGLARSTRARVWPAPAISGNC